MFGLVVHSVGGLLFMLLWIWAVLDVIATDSIVVRNLPKGTWLFLVIVIPTVGAVAWLALGRPVEADFSLGGQRTRPYEYNPERSRRSVRGPEDDPSWNAPAERSLPSSMQHEEPLAIRERKLLEKEAELAKREAELEAQATNEALDEEGDDIS